MSASSMSPLGKRLLRLMALVRRPELLIFLPAVTLAGFWTGGERVLLLLAIGLPVLFAVTSNDGLRGLHDGGDDEDFSTMERAIQRMDRALASVTDGGRNTACMVVQFDNLDRLLAHHGRSAQAEVLARSADRIRGALRVGDYVTHLHGGTLAVVLTPARRLDLESMVQLGARLQSSVAEPVSLGGAHVYLTCSVGFCIGGRSPERTGRSLLDAAQAASDEALRHGPGGLRAWSPDLAHRRAAQVALRDGLEVAIERGEILPYFQPQISTDTGEISGFEALARWHHPERGCLPPAEFLQAIEDSDLGDRLGETMLRQALSALADWDRAGLKVPSVSVNFSASELRSPRLPERIRWELDRHDLKPQRLTVEILETVIAATENDVIVSNIAQLAAMGCGMDLDDFGTGHASISTIRRFVVRRLKIDRSFIMRVDQDREQQRMISAILSLAERLGLDTIAEGVETAGEHAMLSQLGCGHVQGFGLARPMPLEEATQWITRHAARSERIPRIGLRGL